MCIYAKRRPARRLGAKPCLELRPLPGVLGRPRHSSNRCNARKCHELDVAHARERPLSAWIEDQSNADGRAGVFGASPPFNRTVVLRYRIHLEQRRYAPARLLGSRRYTPVYSRRTCSSTARTVAV
jgi:hypothetical protein